MARIKRPRRCARPISDDGGSTDRLSALPDNLLRLILRCLDTRTALSTAVLARRWARLPREVPALEIRVGDVLPRRYHHGLALRGRSRAVPGNLLAADAEWEVVQEQECPWSDVEKMVVRRQVRYGRTWCRPQLQVVVD
ncbi:hypothetical protein SETIT_7G064900v2 [Setaria italica]|uniref:F-box domain-containing protein n=1 Tax=Setaria italica TaxID=4555 RepID=K3YC77_SETIT|nr:hypothetical protein SETIT_7G064900v2 [Setaria italica]